jgi:DNA-binding transcriptional regulator YhcF (GntR family)
MIINIDFRSPIPISVQIIAQIKNLIEIGELAAGERLPTVRALGAELQINFTTVARAYRALDSEGLISTQHGRGTFVLGPTTQGENERLREQSLENLTRTYIMEAQRLGFDTQVIQKAVQKNLKEGSVH